MGYFNGEQIIGCSMYYRWWSRRGGRGRKQHTQDNQPTLLICLSNGQSWQAQPGKWRLSTAIKFESVV